MPIYAANHILKAVKNFDEGGRRLAGLILKYSTTARGKPQWVSIEVVIKSQKSRH